MGLWALMGWPSSLLSLLAATDAIAIDTWDEVGEAQVKIDPKPGDGRIHGDAGSAM